MGCFGVIPGWFYIPLDVWYVFGSAGPDLQPLAVISLFHYCQFGTENHSLVQKN